MLKLWGTEYHTTRKEGFPFSTSWSAAFSGGCCRKIFQSGTAAFTIYTWARQATPKV